MPIYIILVTRVIRDHLHSVIELALDRTEVCKAFEDHFYNNNACQDHRISFYTCIVYMATPHNLTKHTVVLRTPSLLLLLLLQCEYSASGYSASGSRTKVYFEELLGYFQAHQSVVAAVGSSLASPTANLAGTYPSGLETIRGSFCQNTSSG